MFSQSNNDYKNVVLTTKTVPKPSLNTVSLSSLMRSKSQIVNSCSTKVTSNTKQKNNISAYYLNLLLDKRIFVKHYINSLIHNH